MDNRTLRARKQIREAASAEYSKPAYYVGMSKGEQRALIATSCEGVKVRKIKTEDKAPVSIGKGKRQAWRHTYGDYQRRGAIILDCFKSAGR